MTTQPKDVYALETRSVVTGETAIASPAGANEIKAGGGHGQRKRGRPRKSDPRDPFETVCIRLPQSVYDRLCRDAGDTPLSEYLRNFVTINLRAA